MTLHDEISCRGDAVPVLGFGDVLAHRSPGCFLHGSAIKNRPLPQCVLLFLGEPQCHRHETNGIK